MKSFEKKILLVFFIAVVSTLVQRYFVPYVEPTIVDQIFVESVFIAVWAVVNYLALNWCVLAILFWQIVRLRSKYRYAKMNYNNGLPVRLPIFFKFMKWLNTDD